MHTIIIIYKYRYHSGSSKITKNILELFLCNCELNRNPEKTRSFSYYTEAISSFFLLQHNIFLTRFDEPDKTIISTGTGTLLKRKKNEHEKTAF